MHAGPLALPEPSLPRVLSTSLTLQYEELRVRFSVWVFGHSAVLFGNGCDAQISRGVQAVLVLYRTPRDLVVTSTDVGVRSLKYRGSRG